MKQSYIYAALLLHEEKKEITPDSIMAVLKAAGADPEEALAKSVAESLKDVDIDKIITEAATFTPVQATMATTPQAKPEKTEEKEKKEEKKAEESVEGLAALFG